MASSLTLKVFMLSLVSALIDSATFLGQDMEQVLQKMKHKRIVNGHEVSHEEVPWQVSINYIGQYSRFPFCGGTLIDSAWVLTAAHCTEDYWPKELAVVIGETLLHKSNILQKVLQIIQHPEYDPRFITNDISLLKIQTPHHYKGNPISIDLEDRKDLSGIKCTISGWGLTKDGGVVSYKLLAADVPVMSDSYCSLKLIYYVLFLPSTNVCAGGDIADTCQGDSGGPLFCCENSSLKSCKLLGITSWGIGCAIGYPGVYTEVAYFYKWIKDTIAKN